MKPPRMTGKEIILRHLETHARFSAPELVEKLGVKRTVINQAAAKMVREGLLVVDGYTDKVTHYRKPTKKELRELERRAEQQQKPSVIQDCKRSEIMKRILFVFGASRELPVITTS
ncbi:TPA: GntR family transcriptional regulator [Escherichia coli]|uniref:MarR family transcriptional regulator n=1 Tax=Escherichia coli TaxID=562 RepID=UPI000BE51840|nr:helix-turn-helix domain-containing protein [Escherichia coli]EFC5374460.1 GntR family transcriptional regulator [Escherichia coli]EGO4138951.1 GntR family transcriptional regulator [Escherichia coli]EHL6434485.1 GntR family transcriptional regulator [Escherichia coli]EJD9549586.1 GntR family transcriptional regulator [Escherichia coli]EJD9573760.1 GntR family transcriptional regulator [Escherichia coli]